jgi:hypothetical protein
MRPGAGTATGLVLLAWASLATSHAETPSCSKADFEAVVDEAAAGLRELTRENTPPFQGKLRQLKAKRGWSNDQFLKEAEPYVRDETIAAFDRKAEDFLLRITSGGQSQAAAVAPDCALLADLHAAMKSLVETQKAKWAYMFQKLDRDLAK